MLVIFISLMFESNKKSKWVFKYTRHETKWSVGLNTERCGARFGTEKGNPLDTEEEKKQRERIILITLCRCREKRKNFGNN